MKISRNSIKITRNNRNTRKPRDKQIRRHNNENQASKKKEKKVKIRTRNRHLEAITSTTQRPYFIRNYGSKSSARRRFKKKNKWGISGISNLNRRKKKESNSKDKRNWCRL